MRATTLVIGLRVPLTVEQNISLVARIKALLPPGTEVLLIGSCTGLAVIEGEVQR